jgi:hypothetical protein
MTSLFDAECYPATEFAVLTHGRWRIEEAFKRLKHRLGLEHTSGLSGHAARQDFGVKAICDNLNALAGSAAADGFLDEKSDYKINHNWDSTRSNDNWDAGCFWQKRPFAISRPSSR